MFPFLSHKNHIVNRILFINLNISVSHESNLFSIHFFFQCLQLAVVFTHANTTIPSDMHEYVYLFYNFCSFLLPIHVFAWGPQCVLQFTLISTISVCTKNEFGFYFVFLSLARHFLFRFVFILVFFFFSYKFMLQFYIFCISPQFGHKYPFF